MRAFLLGLLLVGGALGTTPAEGPVVGTPVVQAGPKLLIWVELTPTGFAWEELQLQGEADFRAPLAEAWARWWRENSVPGVGEVVACEVNCRAELARKRAGEAVEALQGAWLLEIRVQLTRTSAAAGLAPEARFAWQGGMILQALDDKSVRRWMDLSPEEHPVPVAAGKEANSRLASLLYRGPIGKFLALKGDFPSAGPRRTYTLTIRGAKHVGQLWETVAWLKSTLAELSPEVKLASFDSREARILIFFHGEEEKLQALVQGKGGLESKLGPAFQSQYNPGGAVIAPTADPAGPTEAP